MHPVGNNQAPHFPLGNAVTEEVLGNFSGYRTFQDILQSGQISCLEGPWKTCKAHLKAVKEKIEIFFAWLSKTLFGPPQVISVKYFESLDRLHEQLEQKRYQYTYFDLCPKEIQKAVKKAFISMHPATCFEEQIKIGGKDFKKSVELLRTMYRLDHLSFCRKLLRKDYIDLPHLHPNPYKKAYKNLPKSLQKELFFRVGRDYRGRYPDERDLFQLGKKLISKDPRDVLLPIINQLIAEEKSHKETLLSRALYRR